MKSVAPYKERTRSVFCANCGGVVVDAMAIKDVEALTRSGAAFNCASCAPSASRIEELLAQIKSSDDAHELMMRFRIEEHAQDIALLRAKIEVEHGALNGIALQRRAEFHWKAANN